ncbi:helix-turn-helix domain-containing protein [Alkalihalophilus lindianensis]|uniref:Helix-turn-helix domain-containing protein n=1 Tax=Alkalihalophilus lindianensis TaxID=1630542 RepID=A0ABU3XBD2_9BACI|nr:helix-turn-helix domain-containing protein [Alkalihalophilus lindianensis]MDV2685195.1 helix-turn-helix domain-containing protein [Alkalihalophilus lindianensis]
MNNNIGERIKRRRMEVGITQKDLSEGICTQAQISNIEKGLLKNPSSTLLYEISKKLKVSLNYFFEDNVSHTSKEFEEIQNMINQLKTERNYSSIRYIVENELTNNASEYGNYEIRYLNWHKGICNYYLNNDLDNSIKLLKDQLNSYKTVSSRDSLLTAEIKTSIAVILQEAKLFQEALNYYNDASNDINLLNTEDLFKVRVKILFGLAQTYTYLDQFKDSIAYGLRAITICNQNYSTYLLADLHYQIGYNYLRLQKKEEGMEYINIALCIYKVQGNTKMINIVNEQISLFS